MREPNVVGEVLGRVADLEVEIREIDPLELTAEERARAHVRAGSRGGRELLVSVPRGQELREGDVLALQDGVAVVVAAAPEDLLEVRPRGDLQWGMAAYQLGNLHRPVRFAPDEMLTPYEPSVEEALRSLGVQCRRVRRGFTGERVAAYAGSHGHDHHHHA